MKFGMLHLYANPGNLSERQAIREQLELMRAAEDLDFDSVWPAEHHFSPLGYTASPVIGLAALAAETSRIRPGTGVVVLPLVPLPSCPFPPQPQHQAVPSVREPQETPA